MYIRTSRQQKLMYIAEKLMYIAICYVPITLRLGT